VSLVTHFFWQLVPAHLFTNFCSHFPLQRFWFFFYFLSKCFQFVFNLFWKIFF
jgi:hypothetical protein